MLLDFHVSDKMEARFVGYGFAVCLCSNHSEDFSGISAFKFIGDSVTRFLEYTDVGSAFVFGEAYIVHYIAFKVGPEN